ncbi:glycosyltransferase family 4 protein [Pedobacter frigiditerrae]|uniref:glycosyltransferase family 4 protein n=1 Tax=Pedobacter frigiditerrae TaxID=2530452 RepID=UPI00293192B7|nr:glycosyltransferase family 4 protein [Pedobacter frigiditerrae]
MKIAIIADPFIPIPPQNYGGIERIIDFLSHGLTAKGHDVLLVANKDSSTSIELLKFPAQSGSLISHLENVKVISKLYRFKPDIIHSFGRLAYLLPFFNSKIPKLMSYQREPTIKQIVNAKKIFKKNTLSFTGCSSYISNQISPYAPSYPIFNGVDLGIYHFNAIVSDHAPLVFLGRIEPIKGTHIAIEVAQRTGKKLVIAGNIPSVYQDYFHQDIKPHLNEQISYIGPVDDVQKNILLRNASGFLMPIEWNEPFGIVMAEAMACGTPIIGFNRGSVSEVIINGLNGYSCNTIDEMVDLIDKIPQLDRKKVRQDCEKRFSSIVIIDQYLDLYQKMINSHK